MHSGKPTDPPTTGEPSFYALSRARCLCTRDYPVSDTFVCQRFYALSRARCLCTVRLHGCYR